jgi:lipoprotein-releasing system ATP-binding protein
MSGVAVAVRGLAKSYQDGRRRVDVLREVDFAADPGDLVAVVGPSGSGKSTLLHLLGGLDVADAGTIRVGGQDLARLNGHQLAAFRNTTVGFVFQFHQLLPDFTARENAAMPGRIAGWSAAKAERRAAELFDEVGLADRAHHFPTELSGGERQRVALCRALLLEPPLLLADEPTGNLDPAAAEQVFELFLRLQRVHGTTAIMVTHNPELARRCAKLVLLEGGRLRPLSAFSA